MRRLLFAFAVSCALVLAAPLLGEARSVLRARFPGQVGGILNVAVLLMAAVAVSAAVARIRNRRALRFGLIAAAVVVAVAASSAFAGASALATAAERFHFISYGAVTWLFYRAFDRSGEADVTTFLLPVLCSLIVGVFDEAFQWFVPGRVGEVRDVFLNSTAIAAGLLFSLGVSLPRAWSWSVPPAALRTLGTVLALTVSAVAAFVHLVHLGHIVDDADVGRFVSRFSKAQLTALAADRLARWTASPPPLSLVRLSREDQYLAEGIWHIQARNAAWASDPRRAWHENLILERYFAPVLDTPSQPAPEVSRWPAVQRDEADRRVGSASGAEADGFVSQAAPLPIWPISPLWLWAGAAVAVCLVAGPLAWRSGRP